MPSTPRIYSLRYEQSQRADEGSTGARSSSLSGCYLMNRSVLLAGVLCIPVFYALLKGDFVVILMSVVAGYVIHTLIG